MIIKYLIHTKQLSIFYTYQFQKQYCSSVFEEIREQTYKTQKL